MQHCLDVQRRHGRRLDSMQLLEQRSQTIQLRQALQRLGRPRFPFYVFRDEEAACRICMHDSWRDTGSRSSCMQHGFSIPIDTEDGTLSRMQAHDERP
jgi:hypothetical protein